MKRLIGLLCGISMMMSLACPVSAAMTDEVKEAAAYLQEHKILAGDESGNLMLDKYLSRAELATILTRIVGNPEHVEADRRFYASQCPFTDVPNWAKHYVGYCASNHLLMGYGNGIYGAADPVTPAAACTVMLRYLEEYENVEWTYETACEKAISEGIAPATALAGDKINRGNMAILIYRSVMQHTEPETDATVPGTAVDPHEVERYIPKVGDVIRCDDGYDYEVTNVERWDANAFADGPLPELPQPTCDWSKMPQVEIPKVELRHFNYGHGDYLFIRNVYESKRMLYTLYNAMGHNEETWSNGAPVLHPSGNPKVRINLTIPADVEPEHFWPWRDSQIVDPFNAHPCGTHNMEAWDVFKDGVFLRTEYNVYHTIR